jgi:hypothetical protein
MFFSVWFGVPFILFLTLFALYVTFIRWLAHTLEGYPMFLIQNGGRDDGVAPRSSRIQPEMAPVLSEFSDRTGVQVISVQVINRPT